MALTRRDLLIAGASSGAAIWLPDAVRTTDAMAARRAPLARGGAFSTGVMSGDPSPTAVTLWSRLDDQEARHARVRLELARDDDFRRVVLRRDVPIAALRDHTVKIRVGGLKPDTRYWFRFSTRTTESEVGRTQTAPPPDSERPMRIGYFSCQDFASGYYGVYRELLRLDPDVVVCGGDYIYERIPRGDGYGGVREEAAGEGPDSLARTIGQYRAKYRWYRTDPDLRELHRLVPLVVQWDDHEVADNWVGTLDQSAADNGNATEAFDRNRILSGIRAWHEYMPALRFRRSYRTHRRLRFGRNVDLFMCDSRSYREDQPCEGEGGQPCPDAHSPRKYLGDDQLAWLKDGLARSPAHWKLVGNQLMIMPFNFAEDVPVEVDSWNGYRVERRDLCAYIGEHARDVVFLTGDIHTFFAGEVRRDGESGPAVATELVGGSTTAPGTAEFLAFNATRDGAPPEVFKPLADPGVTALNPWITFTETRSHGCAFLTAGRDEIRARYLASRDVAQLEASRDVRVIGDLRVARGRPGVEILGRG